MSKNGLGIQIEDFLKGLDLKDIINTIEDKLQIKVELKPSEPIREGLVELFPYGLMAGIKKEKPVFVFKDESEEFVFPIWLGQESSEQIAVGLNPMAADAMFKTFVQILSALEIEIQQLVFTELKDFKVYAELELKHANELKSVRLLAEQCLGLCLYDEVAFYASEELMEKARLMDVELHQPKTEKDIVLENAKIDQKYLI